MARAVHWERWGGRGGESDRRGEIGRARFSSTLHHSRVRITTLRKDVESQQRVEFTVQEH